MATSVFSTWSTVFATSYIKMATTVVVSGVKHPSELMHQLIMFSLCKAFQCSAHCLLDGNFFALSIENELIPQL